MNLQTKMLDWSMIDKAEKIIDTGSDAQKKALFKKLNPIYSECTRLYGKDKNHPIYKHNFEVMLIVMMVVTFGMMSEPRQGDQS